MAFNHQPTPSPKTPNQGVFVPPLSQHSPSTLWDKLTNTSAMDLSSLQQAARSRSTVGQAPRPIFTSLNGDNSWLMSFPRPPEEHDQAGKAYYHVVFEPWLAGPTTLLSAWFLLIQLSEPAAVSTVEQIEAVIRQIEDAAAADSPPRAPKPPKNGYGGGIDTILLGLHLLDHVHEPTLRLFDPAIPVIASPEAAKMVQAWNHFATVKLIQDFPTNANSWQSPGLHPGEPLPAWLRPLRLPGYWELNYCLTIVWTHSIADNQEVYEAVFQTPHGTPLDAGPLDAFLKAEPPTEKLAMLHALKEGYSAWMLNAFGVKAGIALYRKVGGTKYWLPTHNSELLYTGWLRWLININDVERTLDWGLEDEVKTAPPEYGDVPKRPNLVKVGNGESFILE